MYDGATAGADRRNVVTLPTIAVPVWTIGTAQAALDFSQRVAQWLEQSWEAQALAFKTWTEALQSALDPALGTNDMRRMLEVRDTLLAVTLENVARCQYELANTWCSLQRDLAGLAIRGTIDFVRHQPASNASAFIRASDEGKPRKGMSGDVITRDWAGSGYLPWFPTPAA